MAAEIERVIPTENATKSEEKIEYPLEVQYCGGKSYFRERRPTFMAINICRLSFVCFNFFAGWPLAISQQFAAYHWRYVYFYWVIIPTFIIFFYLYCLILISSVEKMKVHFFKILSTSIVTSSPNTHTTTPLDYLWYLWPGKWHC